MFIEYSNKLYLTILIFTPFKYSEEQQKKRHSISLSKTIPIYFSEDHLSNTSYLANDYIHVKAYKIWFRMGKKETTRTRKDKP